MSRVVATYEYRDRDGRLAYSVLRYEPKDFSFEDSKGCPLDKLTKPILYRLPEIDAADPMTPILLVEGEKDVDTLCRLGYVATTNPGGCGLGWLPSFTAELVDRIVLVLPDNDRVGKRRAETIIKHLRRVARAVVEVRLPRLQRTEDVTDWLRRRNGSKHELDRLIARALYGLVGLRNEPTRKADQRDLIIDAALSPTAKLVLLVLWLHDCWAPHGRSKSPAITAEDLAEDTGLHRVTVQRTLTDLRKRGILTRSDDGTWTIHWLALVAECCPPQHRRAQPTDTEV